MISKLRLLMVATLAAVMTSAQTGSTAAPTPIKGKCGTIVPTAAWDKWFNREVEKLREDRQASKSPNVTITIPVIVHVIHGGQSVGLFPNINQNQIRSQIAVLNKDFAGNGLNSNLLASTGFSTVGASNTNITFCLAQYDPNGTLLAEPGIERVNYVAKGWQNPNSFATTASFQGFMDNTVKPATIWDPTFYMNIWVSDVHQNAGILGYATFPAGTALSGLPGAGSATTDGIWVWSRSFGNVGTLSAPYNKGRTATHEAGHWLGLRHIGGDAMNPSGDCNATDYCNDTPPQKGGYFGGSNGQNFGAPTYPLNANSCGSAYGDMFMNFMDYTDDASLYMFTPDQNERIQAAMQSGIFRNQLGASSATLCYGLPYADFMSDPNGCVAIDQTFLDQSFGTIDSYSWTTTPSGGVSFNPSSTAASPMVTFSYVGDYTITLVTTNTIGVTSATAALKIADCGSVGLRKNQPVLHDVSINPNPSTGLFQVKGLSLTSKPLQLDVYDALGQVVLQKNYDGLKENFLQIDLSEYQNGLYILSFKVGEEKLQKRVVLTR
jgi:hypothetical protein